MGIPISFPLNKRWEYPYLSHSWIWRDFSCEFIEFPKLGKSEFLQKTQTFEIKGFLNISRKAEIHATPKTRDE